MADEKEDKNSKNVKKDVYIPQTQHDVQRRKIEKLMSNPDKPVVIPGQKKEWKPSDPKDFVRFVMGSSAGAGSGEFHVYRATRRRENNRLKYIDDKAKKEDADAEYHKKQEENETMADEKTAKKRAKRLKKKQKKQALKKSKQDNVKDNASGEGTKESSQKENTQNENTESEDDSDEEKT
ncbi:PRKR-interacting 1 homolog [Paramuricea clavata]|uniref:PRKR-interacting 1 homolog n=1 Tax=Paramuricea clavata TaxID=317549 RepID=A0A6S7I0P9_PARCT|nr:PRKR-interacting 1 homolog [Paramuricea clavata]